MRQLITTLLVFAYLTSCQPPTKYGKEVETEKVIELDSLFKEYHKVGKFNGNVLVAENGKINI